MGTRQPSRPGYSPPVRKNLGSWRAILDSYPAAGFPGARTAIGEVWYDTPETHAPYLEPGGPVAAPACGVGPVQRRVPAR